MDLLGDGDDGAAAGAAGGEAGLNVGVGAIAVGADGASGQRAAIDGRLDFAAGFLGKGEDGGEAGALRAGEASALLGAVVVGEYGDLVIGGERCLDGIQRGVDLGHDVGGKALVDDEGDGEGERIDGEEGDVLAGVVFVDLEVAPGEAGYELSLAVFDGDGNHDFSRIEAEHHVRVEGFRGGGLEGVFALGGGSLGAGRGLVRGAAADGAGVGRSVPAPRPGVMGPSCL